MEQRANRVQFLPGSVLYAGCAHSLLHQGDTDQTLGSVSDFHCAGNASGDSIAASRPVLPGSRPQAFRYAGSLFQYPEHPERYRFSETHNVRTTANDGFQVVNTPFESSALTRTMVSISRYSGCCRRDKPCGGRCLFHVMPRSLRVKHQGISRVDEGVADHRGIGPGTNNMLRRVRVLRCCSEAESLAILPWQSRDTAGACQQGSSRARKMQSSAPLSSTFSCTRARCSGRERPEWWCELHRQTFLNAAIDLQVDILRIEWGDGIITSPDSRVPATAGWFIFIFTCFSCGGLLTSCRVLAGVLSRFCK